MKRMIAILLAMALVFVSFPACESGQGATEESGPVEETPAVPRVEASEMSGKLKVLTERFYWDYSIDLTRSNKSCPVYTMISQAVKYLMQEYPDLEIEVETLTIDLEQREKEIQQRRVALMAGDVPDVYLLPTYCTNDIWNEQKEFLFRDVEQAMGNGWFADISGLYNGDEELHTEELNKTIMDAGTIDAARYVLPLWYNFPVIFSRKDLIESSGIDWESMGEGTEELNRTVVDHYEKTGDFGWSTYYLLGHPLDLLPELCDYEKEEVLLDSKAIGNFMRDLGSQDEVSNANWEECKRIEEETGEYPSYPISLDSFLYGGGYCLDELHATTAMPLSYAFDIVPSGKSLGYEIEMLPLRSSDHKLNAQVTYWGAVSSACENPAAGYELLRFFLMPEVQYGEKVGKFDLAIGGPFSDQKMREMTVGPMPGWPVRYKGFAEKQWARHLNEISHTNYPSSYPEKVMEVTIDDSDFPILDEPIDGVRFPSVLDVEFKNLMQSEDKETNPDARYQKMANDFIRTVKYHLAEG